MTTQRQKQIEKLDILFSKLIRLRDGRCLRCGTLQGLECSHTVTREDLNLRWDFMNAITLCYRCHANWHKYPEEGKEWMLRKYPEFYAYAVQHRYEITQFKVDLDSVLKLLKEKEKEYNITKSYLLNNQP